MMQQFVLIILMSFFLSSAWAYQCGQPREFDEEYNRASAIFIGKVVSISDIDSNVGQVLVLFDVEKFYKTGKLNKIDGSQFKIDITLDSVGCPSQIDGCCGREITQGERYLVYAYPHKDAHEVMTFDICTRGITPCSRTNLIESAQEDLKQLEAIMFMSKAGPILRNVFLALDYGHRYLLSKIIVARCLHHQATMDEQPAG